jgi:hypothetical protein
VTTSSRSATSRGATNRRPWARQLCADSVYLFTGFPIAVVSFSVLVSCFATGASLLITLVGLPILVLTCVLARHFARLERLRIAWVTRRPTPEPAYRPRTRGGIGALVDAALDPQAIRDVVHGVAVFAVSCVTWTVGIVWAAMAPITVMWLHSGDDAGSDGRRVPNWLGVDSHAGRTWLYVAVAVFCVVTLPLVIRGLRALQVAFGRSLLTQADVAPSTVMSREPETAGAPTA